MAGEISTVVEGSLAFMPVMSTQQALERRQALVDFYKRLLTPAVDYGKIPGSDKPTLLKPGAEKLCTLFGLSVGEPDFIERSEDWTGKDHAGEPFFYYLIRQNLYRNGNLVASQVGSANSWEKKYRYRSRDRVCPHCNKPCIIKGKEEYGGGFICFAKKGGCGTKYRDNDPLITEQQTGQVANPDIADIVNTLQKIAQKRALVAAVLLAVNASEFFTQDIEDVLAPHVDQPTPPDPFAGRPSEEGMDDTEIINEEQLEYLCDQAKRKGYHDARSLISWVDKHCNGLKLEKLGDMPLYSYRKMLESMKTWKKQAPKAKA